MFMLLMRVMQHDRNTDFRFMHTSADILSMLPYEILRSFKWNNTYKILNNVPGTPVKDQHTTGIRMKITGHEKGWCDFYVSKKCGWSFCHWPLKMAAGRLGKREREREQYPNNYYFPKLWGLCLLVSTSNPQIYTSCKHIYRRQLCQSTCFPLYCTRSDHRTWTADTHC